MILALHITSQDSNDIISITIHLISTHDQNVLHSAALWSKSVEEYHRSLCAPHLTKRPHVLVVWYYLSYHFLFWKCNKIILQQISFCFLTTDTCLVFIASAHSLPAYHCGGFLSWKWIYLVLKNGMEKWNTLSWNGFTLYGCEVRIRRYVLEHRNYRV